MGELGVNRLSLMRFISQSRGTESSNSEGNISKAATNAIEIKRASKRRANQRRKED